MAPQAFDSCIKNGGRVRTKKLSGGRYLHICFLNGKSFAGEVKTAKTPTKTKSNSELEKTITK